RRSFEAARDALQDLLRLGSSAGAARVELAGIYAFLGTLYQNAGRTEEAIEHEQKARDLYQALSDEKALGPAERYRWGKACHALGLLLEIDRPAEAKKNVQQAIEIRRTLVKESPKSVPYRINLAGSLCNLGNLISRGGQPRESLAPHDEAVGLLQAV